MTNSVKIERGVLSSYFQVARSWISAASGVMDRDRNLAIAYIDGAIDELKALRKKLVAAL